MERQNGHARLVSRRKNTLIWMLLVLVVLATTLLYVYVTPAHTWIASLFQAQVKVAPLPNSNSDATMFGYDLQHTRYNTREHRLTIGNASHLHLAWSVATN